MVKQIGFKTAVTTGPWNIFKEHKNYLECLPRIPIIGDQMGTHGLDLYTSGYYPARINNYKRIISV